MADWQSRLYDAYVTTGQAGPSATVAVSDNAYYHDLVRRHLPADRGARIVDLACGHGVLLWHVKKHGYANVAGVDISREQVEVAHRLGLTEIRCQALQDYLREIAPGSCDVVFMMDILEHLDPPTALALLDDVHRVLKPGGRAIIHVPNAEGIFGMRIRYGDFTHCAAFTARSMEQVLRACGFTDVACFEDQPVAHGLKSAVRRLLWRTLTLPFRVLLAAESGVTRAILSQNLLAVARR